MRPTLSFRRPGSALSSIAQHSTHLITYGFTAVWLLLGLAAHDAHAQTIQPCSADFDSDGRVDLQDFNTLSANFAPGGCTDCAGDADQDGDIDITDFRLLSSELGRTDCPLAIRVVEACRADCSGPTPGQPDGRVNIKDARHLMSTFLHRGPDGCDGNANGITDMADWNILTSEYDREECPPLQDEITCEDMSVFGSFEGMYADPLGRADLCWLDDPAETGCDSSDLSCGRSVTFETQYIVYESAHSDWYGSFVDSPDLDPTEPTPHRFGPVDKVQVFGQQLILRPTEGCDPEVDEVRLTRWLDSERGFIDRPLSTTFSLMDGYPYEGFFDEALSPRSAWAQTHDDNGTLTVTEHPTSLNSAFFDGGKRAGDAIWLEDGWFPRTEKDIELCPAEDTVTCHSQPDDEACTAHVDTDGDGITDPVCTLSNCFDIPADADCGEDATPASLDYTGERKECCEQTCTTCIEREYEAEIVEPCTTEDFENGVFCDADPICPVSVDGAEPTWSDSDAITAVSVDSAAGPSYGDFDWPECVDHRRGSDDLDCSVDTCRSCLYSCQSQCLSTFQSIEAELTNAYYECQESEALYSKPYFACEGDYGTAWTAAFSVYLDCDINCEAGMLSCPLYCGTGMSASFTQMPVMRLKSKIMRYLIR